MFTTEEIEYLLKVLESDKKGILDPYVYMINKHCRLILESIRSSFKEGVGD